MYIYKIYVCILFFLLLYLKITTRISVALQSSAWGDWAVPWVAPAPSWARKWSADAPHQCHWVCRSKGPTVWGWRPWVPFPCRRWRAPGVWASRRPVWARLFSVAPCCCACCASPCRARRRTRPSSSRAKVTGPWFAVASVVCRHCFSAGSSICLNFGRACLTWSRSWGRSRRDVFDWPGLEVDVP